MFAAVVTPQTGRSVKPRRERRKVPFLILGSISDLNDSIDRCFYKFDHD